MRTNPCLVMRQGPLSQNETEEEKMYQNDTRGNLQISCQRLRMRNPNVRSLKLILKFFRVLAE